MPRYTTELNLAADIDVFGPGAIVAPKGHEPITYIASLVGTKAVRGRQTGTLTVDFKEGKERREYRLSGDGGIAAGIASKYFKIEGPEIRLSKSGKSDFRRKLAEVPEHSTLHRHEYKAKAEG